MGTNNCHRNLFFFSTLDSAACAIDIVTAWHILHKSLNDISDDSLNGKYFLQKFLIMFLLNVISVVFCHIYV
jgi:hypothetical protein